MPNWKEYDDGTWEHPTYNVTVSHKHKDVIALFVSRRDGRKLGTERFHVLQEVKSVIVGPDHTAIEIYPPESELRDRVNVYWLYVFRDPNFRFPFQSQAERSIKGEKL